MSVGRAFRPLAFCEPLAHDELDQRPKALVFQSGLGIGYAARRSERGGKGWAVPLENHLGIPGV